MSRSGPLQTHLPMSTPALEDDATLVRRIRAGEPRLFERLVRRSNQRCYRTARAQLGNDAEAEDVVQQSWLAIYRSLAQWTGRPQEGDS